MRAFLPSIVDSFDGWMDRFVLVIVRFTVYALFPFIANSKMCTVSNFTCNCYKGNWKMQARNGEISFIACITTEWKVWGKESEWSQFGLSRCMVHHIQLYYIHPLYLIDSSLLYFLRVQHTWALHYFRFIVTVSSEVSHLFNHLIARR